MSRDPRRWGDPEQALLDAIAELLGQPSGSKGRSTEAFRQASRRLADAGVVPETLPDVVQGYAVESLKALGPMPLAAHVSGALRPQDSRVVIVNRWAGECSACDAEVPRGALAWFRRPDDGRGYVTCAECEPVDHTWERSAEARRRALAKDDDPDDLLERILAQTPALHREELADELAPHAAVRESG